MKIFNKCKHCNKPIPYYTDADIIIDKFLCNHCWQTWLVYHKEYYDTLKGDTFKHYCADKKYDKVERFIFR